MSTTMRKGFWFCGVFGKRRRTSSLLLLSSLVGLYLLASFSTWIQFHQNISVENTSSSLMSNKGLQIAHHNQNPSTPRQINETEVVEVIVDDGLKPSNQHPEDPREYLSSVDYFACCGLGHRLIRQSLAYYVARQRNFTLRSFWGWCGEEHQVEVFSYLFRPQSAKEVAHVTSQNIIVPFYNEVAGFKHLVRRAVNNRTRTGNRNNSRRRQQPECQCQQDKIDSDLEIYTSLRDRFRGSKVVNEFVQQNFENATVLGIHVRAGNGEVGDFSRKGRGIDNPVVWVENVCKQLELFLAQQPALKYPPLLYIATDTPSMIGLFRTQLSPLNIRVVDLPQHRPDHGAGVLFGEAKQIFNKGEDGEDDSIQCLQGWEDTLTDMFLLSHADVVIASRPSSFSQAVPMSLAFGRDKLHRKVDQVYCEVIPQFQNTSVGWQEIAPIMTCFKDYLEWCCEHSTWIKFTHKKTISREFIKFPNPGPNAKEYSSRIRDPNCKRPKRGRAGGGVRDKCIPHTW